MIKTTRTSLLVVTVIIVATTSCKLYYPVQQVSYTAQPADVEHGKRLTMMMCGPCHYNSSTKRLTGKKLEDTPSFIGKVYASNITQDAQHGIGSYSDAQLAYLLRTGVSRSGKLMPYMQRPNLSDADLSAIIKYLHSDDELVKASPEEPGKTKYSPLGKFGISMAKPLPYSGKAIERPGNDKISEGKYLVDNLGCFHCHSKSFAAIDPMEPQKSKGYMGGGNKMRDASGKKVKSPNLTPHVSGIGTWTQEEFKRAITEGISKDNSVITFPMPLYPQLTDVEIGSIYAYLQSVPPIAGN